MTGDPSAKASPRAKSTDRMVGATAQLTTMEITVNNAKGLAPRTKEPALICISPALIAQMRFGAALFSASVSVIHFRLLMAQVLPSP